MGYDLTIGEAEFKVDKVGDDFVDNIQEECIRVTVAEIKHDNAPAFGEPTDYTNVRWPSYSSWAIFCEFAELEHVFYEMDEHDNCTGHLRGGHPGVMPITPSVKEEVDRAYKRLKMQYKTVDPTLGIFETEVGGAWARVQWLKYWIDWSLENCKVPVMVNT